VLLGAFRAACGGARETEIETDTETGLEEAEKEAKRRRKGALMKRNKEWKEHLEGGKVCSPSGASAKQIVCLTLVVGGLIHRAHNNRQPASQPASQTDRQQDQKAHQLGGNLSS